MRREKLLVEFFAKFRKKRDNPRRFALSVAHGEPLRVPINVVPTRFENFRRAPQTADSAQRENRSPILIGTSVQQTPVPVARNEKFPPLVLKTAAINVGERMRFEQIRVDGPIVDRPNAFHRARRRRFGVTRVDERLAPLVGVGFRRFFDAPRLVEKLEKPRRDAAIISRGVRRHPLESRRVVKPTPNFAVRRRLDEYQQVGFRQPFAQTFVEVFEPSRKRRVGFRPRFEANEQLFKLRFHALCLPLVVAGVERNRFPRPVFIVLNFVSDRSFLVLSFLNRRHF